MSKVILSVMAQARSGGAVRNNFLFCLFLSLLIKPTVPASGGGRERRLL